MVAGIRSCLAALGVDLATEVVNARLVLSSESFATGDGGTGIFPLVNFIGAKDTIQISTRLEVKAGDDNALIAGFIINGTGTTRALLRAIGPSLVQLIPNALPDPVLELRYGQLRLAFNDNWRDSQEYAIYHLNYPYDPIAPTNPLESAILAFLSPGAYTAVVGEENNTPGVALVEVYDMGVAFAVPPDNARLANISTRGFVGAGDNVIIGGFIIRPPTSATTTRVIIRAIGPSLTAFGVAHALADPTLELRDGDGTMLIWNNDWQDDATQAGELTSAGLAPMNALESGIAATLPLGPYTAIVSANRDTPPTGVALVEVYSLP